MAAHIITAIRQAREEKVNAVNEISTLLYYKQAAGYGAWGKALDLRDLIFIENCQTWQELLDGFERMEKKYRLMWELVGCPRCWEEWEPQLDRLNPNGVSKDYWDLYNTFVDYGVKVRAEVH